jgi:YYY domain-containing protein
LGQVAGFILLLPLHVVRLVIWWFGWFGDSIRWWIVCEVVGFVALPIVFRVFRGLPDRGYPLTKGFGIFWLMLLNWELCGYTPLINSWGSIFVALVVILVVSMVVMRRIRKKLAGFLKSRWRYVLGIELLFLPSFLFFANIRSYTPEITFEIPRSAAEKFGNFAMLNSLMRSRHFPPLDPWLSGYTMNYYYLGHLEWATLGTFSGYPPQITFNIALATIFALTIVNGFSLGYNLTRRIAIGCLAAAAIGLFGNLDGIIQVTHNLGLGQSIRDAICNYDFWRSSRMIENTITEFPYFTAILGDLHAHHSALPHVLLILAICLNMLFKHRPHPMLHMKYFKRYWPDLFLMGILLGALRGINAWDVPTMGITFLALLLYMHYRMYKKTVPVFLHTALVFFGVVLIALIWGYLFAAHHHIPFDFEIKDKSFILKQIEKIRRTVPFLPEAIRTDFPQYWLHFGLFLIPFCLLLWTRGTAALRQCKPHERLALVLGVMLILVIAYAYLHYWLGGVTLVLALWCAALLLTQPFSRAESPVYILACIGFLISTFCEIFYINDRYVGLLERYNTVFKFYYPVWSFFALAFCVSISSLWTKYVQERSMRKLIGLWALLLIVVGLGLIYPIGATASRTNRFNTYFPFAPGTKAYRTLDGMAYLRDIRPFVSDYEGIRFIQQHVKGQPVILEAVKLDSKYEAYSRVSTNTGLPTLVGWSHHENQWRGDKIDDTPFWDVISSRVEAAKQIYNSHDYSAVANLIDKYNIRLIFVGALERHDYDAAGLAKFADACKEVFRSGETRIYLTPEATSRDIAQ